jgi:hypothetical protein
MIKTFCDRCEAETSNVTSGHVMGIPDADEHGNGNVAKQADLCAACYQQFLDFLAEPLDLRRRIEALEAIGNANAV